MATWTPRLVGWPQTPASRSKAGSVRPLSVPAEWLLAAHEIALGRPTLRLARSLTVSQCESPDALAARQLVQLRSLIELAQTASPYYRSLDTTSPETLNGLADLAQWPLLSRDDLRAHAESLCVKSPPYRRLRDHSSGSTGPAVPYYWDRKRQAWDKANRLRGHTWLGFAPGDRELHLWPVDPPTTRDARFRAALRVRRDALVGDLLIDSNADVCASAIWQRWRQFDPARVTAYPSRLCDFIHDARRQGCRLNSPSLRRVLLTGEPTYTWQKSLIERELGVETAQSYGVQEAGAIAFACERGAWHTCAESIIVEFIHNGRAAAPGELAEVVVTSLVNRTMPLIRYRTGDVVRMAMPTPCTCGRTLPVMPHVIGRFGDFIVLPSGEWVEPSTVIAQVSDVIPPGSFQVIQSESGRIEIYVVEGPRSRTDWREAVVERLASLVGRETPTTVRRVPRLSRCASGKTRYVQSQLSLADASTRP